MLQFRKILLCKYLYYSLFGITIFLTLIRLLLPKESKYSKEDRSFTGVVVKIHQKENSTTLYLKNQETVLASSKKKIEDIHLGDQVEVIGSFHKPEKNHTKYLFNYRKYCYHKNIFFLIEIENYQIIKKNHNLFYFLKEKIWKRLHHNPYLSTFILGDKSDLTEEVKYSFQENGISHLFAISGMHIAFLSKILEKILLRCRISKEKSFWIISLFLFFFLFLVGLSPSFLRGVLFYILFSLNDIYYFYIEKNHLFLLTMSISLLINPNYIYDTGFLYSYLISFTLLNFSSFLKSTNYFLSLLKVSLLSFLTSIPITLYTSFQLNLLSILYNLFFVPFVSLFLFPFSLLTGLFSFLEPIYHVFTLLLEKTSFFLSSIFTFKLIFKRLPFLVYLFYTIIILFFILKKKSFLLKILFFFLFLHYLLPTFDSHSYLKVIDVGQGDSLLIHSANQSFLIDTGGQYQEGKVAYQTLIPLLKSMGIQKVQGMILTHGDKDHLGDAYPLLKNYPVDTIYLNQGNLNFFEKRIQKSHKKVFQVKEGEIISIGDITLIQLNKEWEDENDSSSVFLLLYQDIRILLTGDASIQTEKYILDTYDLEEIDILKAGHHGSKTSTSTELLEELKPKFVFISCGKNNKFNHPSIETILKLEAFEIPYYRTDEVGTITFDFNRMDITLEG